MDNQQLLMFKGWFIDSYPECKDYLDLTYFDVEKNTFLSKCSYNPDSGNAAKVLKIAFGSWQHQQAKVEELKASHHGEVIGHEVHFKKIKQERDELQKRVDAIAHLIRGLRAEFDLWMDVECPQVERQIELLEQALKGEG
ncbi:hypothetical protein [Acinetobacter baumannii]|uniref:hypothetical protein n=1 Tax=Acinetobacter baumannii TaxID=470 RepID=UPI000DE5F004|nr:hypothetical protein [Acinetobacter baumannii]MCJ9045671.1 hypothetical protein [Acinetobacter baumannii]MCJ9297203.1 hypothetical protein [Acinetobacter baumannii]MCJ9399238.1 hypothetical protein [Acinetobacter baumannii]MCJ9494788.1 hypothetical protein [Acinetobacter baumannii]QLF11153.1 hypothetical protein F7R60_13505 [Acinetobacter baumannii]